MAETALKGANQKLLGAFLILYGVIFTWFFFGMPPILGAFQSSTAFDWLKGIATSALPLIGIPVNWLPTTDAKAMLVFWRTRHILPSHRFVELAQKDTRVNLHSLFPGDEALPISPEAQNRYWNRCLRKHEGNPAVLSGHRDYLLLRDMTWLSGLVGGIESIILGFRWHAGHPTWLFLIVAGVTFLVLSLAARHAGERFMLTVLSVESSQGPPPPGLVLP